jgi:hypothetical protein
MCFKFIKNHSILLVSCVAVEVSFDYINIVNHNYTNHKFEGGPVIIISI